MLELLIVLAVSTIAITLAAPLFSSVIERHRLKSATEALHSNLQLAKLEAIKRNKRIFVTFKGSSGSTTWCYGIKEAGTCDCNTANSCHLDGIDMTINSNQFPGISVERHISSPGDRFTFEGVRGIMDSTFGYVAFNSSGGKQTRVVVSRLGRIRHCSPAGNANIAGYSTSC